MDLVAIRAELKAWEKAFKAQNGRNPSKDDIKADPEIAQKYKLYSKTRVDPAPTAPSVASEKKRPPPSIAPVTPSKPGPSHFSKDLFKTPTSSAAKRAKAPTEFAFAPSPSRLRALAASKSFSGSPNKSSKTRDYNFSDEPVNLGRSAVVAADTPRTKAAKWLQGDNVSPPKKVSKATQSAQALQSAEDNTATNVPVAKKAVSGNGTSFWTEMEKLKRENPPLADSEMANGLDLYEEDGDDFLAPSPVKPIKAGLKVNKGKQRDIAGMFDLLGASDRSQTASTGEKLAVGSTTSAPSKAPAVGRDSDIFASTSTTSFFSSANPLPSRIAGSRSPSSGPVIANGKPGKTKKRTSTLAALQPFDALAGDSEEENEEKIRLKLDKNKEEAILSALQEEGTEKPRPKPSRNGKRLRSEAQAPRTLDQAADDLHAESGNANGAETSTLEEAMPAEDDYDVRDFSDEYEGYSSQRQPEDDVTESIDNQDALDASIDPNLVSLLSLRTSPVKNRLSRLHKKRDETVSKLLLEPTYLLKEKKEKERKGLEDLSDEEFPGEALQSSDNEKNDGILAAASDDDWASEPEGWKDLGDGEMDGLDW